MVKLTKENIEAFKKFKIWNQLPEILLEEGKSRIIAQYIRAFIAFTDTMNWKEFGKGDILDLEFIESSIEFTCINPDGNQEKFTIYEPC